MTHKYNPLRYNPRGRANIYGLCQCRQCRFRRHAYWGAIEKIKRKWRNEWKNGREFVKGLYTD